jgi:hypothetical protein
MDVFNEASRLNHQGVNALLNGREDLAVQCFTACVTMMKRILSLRPVEPQPSTSILQQAKIQIDQESSNNNNNSSTSSRTVQLPPVMMMHGQSKDDSILFNRAILIPNGHPHHQTPSSVMPSTGAMQHDIHAWMAAVVYNLAIAHHRKGKAIGLVAFTQKAEKLYTMALKFFGDDNLVMVMVNTSNNYYNSNINSCYTADNNSIGLLVKLASLNNLFEIRLESGDHDLAKECLYRVYSLLQSSGFSMRNELSSEAAFFFQEEDIKALLQNLLLLQPPQVAPAA